MKKSIIVTAVNFTEGGPLTILRQCLEAMSEYARVNSIVCYAIVHDKYLCYYDNIVYIEKKWPKRSWLLRMWYEYVYVYFLSLRLCPQAFLSLHDITSSTIASARAVYCHNPSIFYRPQLKNVLFTEYLFSRFYKYLYRINIKKNKYVIVQQNWIKREFENIFHLPTQKVITFLPNEKKTFTTNSLTSLPNNEKRECIFVYPAFPRSFKNFEIICEACSILEQKKTTEFCVKLTLLGNENSYAKRIIERYHHIKSIDFIGLQPKSEIDRLYAQSRCLVFPSKLETWGLPISEYASQNKPIIASDLSYAHETCGGCSKVAFFNPESVEQLAELMLEVINNDLKSFSFVAAQEYCKETNINSWECLFDKLLTR